MSDMNDSMTDTEEGWGTVYKFYFEARILTNDEGHTIVRTIWRDSAGLGSLLNEFKFDNDHSVLTNMAIASAQTTAYRNAIWEATRRPHPTTIVENGERLPPPRYAGYGLFNTPPDGYLGYEPYWKNTYGSLRELSWPSPSAIADFQRNVADVTDRIIRRTIIGKQYPDFEYPTYAPPPVKEEAPEPEPEPNWLHLADQLTSEDRERDYGHPLVNFLRASLFLTDYLVSKNLLVQGRVVLPQDVAWIMVLMKLAREVDHHKADNCIDLIGYTRTIQRMDQKMREIGYEDGLERLSQFTTEQLRNLTQNLVYAP